MRRSKIGRLKTNISLFMKTKNISNPNIFKPTYYFLHIISSTETKTRKEEYYRD